MSIRPATTRRSLVMRFNARVQPGSRVTTALSADPPGTAVPKPERSVPDLPTGDARYFWADRPLSSRAKPCMWNQQVLDSHQLKDGQITEAIRISELNKATNFCQARHGVQDWSLEVQRCEAVDAVALPRGRRAIGKHVTEVGIATGAIDLNPHHAVGQITLGGDRVWGGPIPEAGPTRSGLEFGLGTEQRRPAADAVVHPRGLVVPVSTGERPLGAPQRVTWNCSGVSDCFHSSSAALDATGAGRRTRG